MGKMMTDDEKRKLYEAKGKQLEDFLNEIKDLDSLPSKKLDDIWKKRIVGKDCGKEEFSEAEKIFNRFTKLDENFAEAYHKLGKLYHRLKRYDEAEENYEKALGIEKWTGDEMKARCYRDLGYLLYGRGIHKEAVNKYEKAIAKIAKNKEKAWFYNDLGTALMKLKKYGKAEDALEKALKLSKKEKDKAYVYNALGRLYYRKGLYKRAKEKLEEAKRVNHDIGEIYNNLGLLDFKEGLYENAKEYFETAIEKDKGAKKHPFDIKIKEDVSILEGDLDKGFIPEKLNQELEKFGISLPSPPKKYSVKKEDDKWVIRDEEKKEICCIAKEDGKLSIYAKEECERLSEAHFNLGNIFFNQKKYEEAEKEYEEAIRINRNFAEAYFSLGNLAAEREDKERAEKLYSAALEINPDYTEAKKNLDLLKEEEVSTDWWGWWFGGFKSPGRKLLGWLLILFLIGSIGLAIGLIALGKRIGLNIEKIEKVVVNTTNIISQTSNITTTITTTTPAVPIEILLIFLIALAGFIFLVLISPQLKKAGVSFGALKFELETKPDVVTAGTSKIP